MLTSWNISARSRRETRATPGLISRSTMNPLMASACGPWSREHLEYSWVPQDCLHVGFVAHFTPAVEVGWRLARPFWGQGFAVEAARAALQFGFEEICLTEVVAHGSVRNGRSRRVMEKLGMCHDCAEDFDHPSIPESDPLRRQVLYRLTRDGWLSKRDVL
jgi:RimJ/RimL family protein N-acetyltransferase